MAYLESMDVDHIGSDFDDKENSIQISNVLPRTPCTEKGYEELDVSELNMRLRYSNTPVSSPMSKTYIENFKESKIVSQDDILNSTNENGNLTHSFNSTLAKSETVSKVPKLPLQVSNDQFLNNTMSSSMRRLIDTDANCTITLSEPENIDENLSLPSTSSSLVHTPEAITPTKDIPKGDGGSPIMRGLKSVLNMFRSSPSPIPPEEISTKGLNSLDSLCKDTDILPTTLASTLINDNKNIECNSSKRNSPLKDSVIFNDDLEKELQWKEETTIVFKQEKIPIPKLFFQQPSLEEQIPSNKNVEDIDISYNESVLIGKTMTEVENKTISNIVEATTGIESDSEFVDCETTYTKNEEQSKSELNTLDSDDNANNKTVDINSEAIEKFVDKNCLTLDRTTNEIESEDLNQTNIILPDLLIATNVINDVHNSDEKLVIGTHDAVLNVKDDMCKLSELKNQHALEINDKSNIELQNCEFSSAHEMQLQEVSSAKDNKQIISEIKENNKEKKPHDVTKPLNIITDYPNNENISNSVKCIHQNNNENSLENSGLLKKYDVEEIINIAEITDFNNEEINYVNEDKNVINLTNDLPNVNNENILLNSTGNMVNRILLNIDEKVLRDNVIDNNCNHNIETNIKEPIDNVINVDSNNYEANYTDVSLSFQKPMCFDVTFDNNTHNTQSLDTGDDSKINIYEKSEQKTTEELKNKSKEPSYKVHEVQESFPNELSSAPSDCPLPFDDDVDIHNSEVSLNNAVNIIHNGNLKDITQEIPNNTFEHININNLTEGITTPNDSEILDGTVNKTMELDNIKTESMTTFDSGVPPDHAMILDNSNTDIFMNNSNDNVQSLEEIGLGNQKEINMDNNKIVKRVSPLSIKSCNNEVNNLNNDIKVECIENPFETKTKLQQSPPISPKLSRKGYTINFDEVDDPFVTKTTIRTSPSPETSINTTINYTSQKQIEQKRQMQNRRKSQPERKRQSKTKKPFNMSFESVLMKHNIEESIDINKDSSCNNAVIKTGEPNTSLSEEVITQMDYDIQEDCKDIEIHSQNEGKLSANEVKNENTIDKKVSEIKCSEESSITSTVNKSVFNLPEIDNTNFNPFATKSKVRQTPSPLMTQTPQALNDGIESQSQLIDDITINIESNIQEQHISPSAKSIDYFKDTVSKENTDREVKTEDEDTIEGPFFEADDFTKAEKQSHFELNNDDMPFEDFPVEDKKEELFIDAEAFEFLLNQNQCNIVADSGKESLFLKFDPLFAKRISSDGVLSALNRIQKRQSTPINSTVTDQINETLEPITASTAKNLSEEAIDEPNTMISKPMMVVNPAVNSLVSPRKFITPPRINRQSLTFTSPAMAVIDRLLSLSGNTSLLDNDASIQQPTRECNDTDIALTQLRELLAEKEIHVHNLRSESKELKERLAVMKSQERTLEKESEERIKKVNNLNDRLTEKTKMEKSMALVVEEYERTIAGLIADMDQEKRRNAEERVMLISERDEQTAHLASMEVSYSDLHSKYEKNKQIILSMKVNEDTYKKSINESQASFLKTDNNYEFLKQHATCKLNHANQELEKINKSHQAEVLKLKAMIKRKELHITSLEESLAQTTKANNELAAICDEILNKV